MLKCKNVAILIKQNKKENIFLFDMLRTPTFHAATNLYVYVTRTQFSQACFEPAELDQNLYLI